MKSKGGGERRINSIKLIVVVLFAIFLLFSSNSPAFATPTGYRYYIFEVDGYQSSSNCAVINEVMAIDNTGTNVLLGKTTISAYDQATGKEPYYWNNLYWGQKNLTNGQTGYTYGTTNSSLFLYHGSSTCKARFAYDLGSSIYCPLFKIYIGGKDLRNPVNFKIYGTNNYNDSQVSSSFDDTNLVLLGSISPSNSSISILYNVDSPDSLVPSAPTNLSINNLTLTWNDNPLVDNVTSYNVYKNGSKVGNTTETYYSINDLSIGQYSFTVTAINSVCESLPSSALNYTVLPKPPDITFSDINSTSATISWPTASGVTSYDIYVNGDFVTNITATNYDLSGLLYNKSYTVSIIAKSSVGDSAASTKTFITSDLVSPPSGLQATNITTTSLDLSWDAVTGATSYILDQNDNILATTTNNFYHCSGLQPNTTYTYKVAVTTVTGISDYSNNVSVTTCGNPPTVPSGLSAGNITGSAFTAYWFRQSDANDYKIYLDGNYVADIPQTLLLNPSYDFSGLLLGTSYNVTVIAVNNWGESSASSPLIVTTKNVPQSPSGLSAGNITETSFTIYWLKQSDATNYNVYMDGKLIGNVSQPLFYNPSIDINNLINGSTHTMTITALNQLGESLSSMPLIVTVTIPRPVLTVNVDNNNLKLSWTGIGNDYDILVNGNKVNQVSDSPYNLTEKPGTYQIQVIQNYKGQQYPSNVLTVMISALQSVGATQITGDILSNVGVVMAPLGGLIAIALALKGSPWLIMASKNFFLKL